MKKDPTRPLSISEHDIRAYAGHLYEQSGRIPGRDLDHWLEAERCLLAAARARLRIQPRRSRRKKRAAGAHGFTMPPSDASLCIEKAACTGEVGGPDTDKQPTASRGAAAGAP